MFGELAPETEGFSPLALRRRHDAARLLHSKLQGVRFANAKAAEELEGGISLAKGRLGCAAETASVLSELQRRAHGRAVGVFEDLLSAILEDVLPGEGRIKLDLDLRGTSQSLDINLERADGMVADVLDATGGAVTNTVCAGLRYAALSRTSNRRFIVLDEPDCWLKPSRVPAFVRVLADVARQTGTQTLFVSHHPAENFAGDVSLVELTRDAQGLTHATALQPVAATWEDDFTPGIRALELVDFMAHAHTTVPLFPGATALIGDNNVGKSAALIGALRAVAYNESTDQQVRFGATSAKVIVHLEWDRKLVWTRTPKKNPVVSYQLIENGVVVKEGKAPGRGSAPEWVTEALGIARVDGLDLQLGNQKSPVFLLNETSGTRAQLLSLGRESAHLGALMKRYDELKRADREEVRLGEPKLQKLLKQLEAGDTLDDIEPVLQDTLEPLSEMERAAATAAELARVAGRVQAATTQLVQASAELAALTNLPTPPVIEPTEALERAIERLAHLRKRAVPLPAWQVVAAPALEPTEGVVALLSQLSRARARVAAAADLPAVPVVPDLLSTDTLAVLIASLATAKARAGAFTRLPALPSQPELVSTDALTTAIAALQSARTATSTAGEELQAATAAWTDASVEYDMLIESLGGVCPLCGGAMNAHAEEEAH